MRNTKRWTRACGVVAGVALGSTLVCVPLTALGETPAKAAQGAVAQEIELSSSSLGGGSSDVLPNAPGRGDRDLAVRIDAVGVVSGWGKVDDSVAAQTPASNTDKYILPGQKAPPLSFGNKFVLGVKDALSPLSAVGWVASAGYEQATDGSPNYGPGGEGFGQRVGAAAARASSEGIFGDSFLSPLLHEDPRYYQMGPGHSFGKRLVYAGTRALITRTDGGRSTPNLGQIGGNLAGAFLTRAYYPDSNTSLSETMQTFGGSVGGSALGFVVSEFFSSAFQFLHLSDNK